MKRSSLAKTNDLSLSSSGVWTADGKKPFDYSDGDTSEKYLNKVINGSQDRSSLSLELESHVFDWTSEYHLSSDRANVYRFLNLDGIASGLELGSGCGAISRYLGEQGMVLDAVEGNIKRAELTRLRCADLENVHVHHSNFNDLHFENSSYDGVFLNGVLEYASKFLPGYDDRDALVEVLGRALKTLKPDGVACIAIENRMGLKYWLGSNEDHYGQPFRGLYGYPAGKGIRTYDYDEWKSILRECTGGFFHRFFFPFPDYKMARAILSESFVTTNPFAHSNLYRTLSTDNGNPVKTNLNEYLLWESLHNSGQLEKFANSFFVVLSTEEQRLDEVCGSDFMHISSHGRKPEYRTVTHKQSAHATVIKKRLIDGETAASDFLQQDLFDTEYETGTLLVSRWIHAAMDDDLTSFTSCLQDYYAYLCEYWQETEDPSDALDLLPFNIVVAENGDYRAIDKEWRTSATLIPEFVLFRALLWFPCSNEMLLGNIAQQNNLSTLFDFIEYGFSLLSLPLQKHLDDFIGLEENFQKEVNGQVRANPVKAMLVEPLIRGRHSVGANVFPAQLYWAEEDESWSEDRSILVSAGEGKETQTLVFDLPHIGEGVSRFRLDPCDRPGFFRIQSVSVFGCDRTVESCAEKLLFEARGGKELAQVAELDALLYCHNGLGETFFSIGEDPSLSFDLHDSVEDLARYRIARVVVEMDWPKSADYLIAMEKVGNELFKKNEKLKVLEELEKISQKQAERISDQAAKLKEKSDQVKTKEIHIQQLEETVTQMQQTRLWRAAEWIRQKIYYRFLDGKALLSKSVQTIKNDGFKHFYRKAKGKWKANPNVATLGFLKSDYDLWVKNHELTEYDIQEIRSNIEAFVHKPLISIVVPVYDVDQKWLELAIESIRGQLYENWELCLCDDCSPSPHVAEVLKRYAQKDERIKVSLKSVNEGIALTSNAALAMATGEYVGLLDHDDELSIDALYENVKVINEYPDVGLIYSDEDKKDMQGHRVDPFFKPDYSPELIYSQNYICHFTVIRKTILDEIGGFSKGFDGSQDHDLILRSIEKAAKVIHIPKILYHWRKIPGSTAAVYDSKSYAWEAGRRAIEASLERKGIQGTVSFAKYQGSYRVSHDITGNPLVTIIIPFKDKPELLKTCVQSIIGKSSYHNFEILGIDNNSEEQKTVKALESLTRLDKRISFVPYSKVFNFAAICNYGVEKARGDYIVFLNNDTAVISPEWIEALLEHAQQPGIGVVGGKLYYPDDTIQHSGVVIGMTGVGGHPFRLFHKDDVGYYARPHVIHNVSAVTGACLMIKKERYEEVGGMDSEKFGIAFNDVDLCMSLLKKGYRNVLTPYCELYHYESQSRGYEDTPEKLARLERETEAFNAKWDNFFENGDPYFSPHLSLDNERFTIQIG
ncbi:MAG: glycosyltransferase [Desulfocapsa sp.]|nr:glycosyltransferase [Desulfocapsa sp.]